MIDYEKFAELQDTAFQFTADSDTCGTVTKNETSGCTSIQNCSYNGISLVYTYRDWVPCRHLINTLI